MELAKGGQKKTTKPIPQFHMEVTGDENCQQESAPQTFMCFTPRNCGSHFQFNLVILLSGDWIEWVGCWSNDSLGCIVGWLNFWMGGGAHSVACGLWVGIISYLWRYQNICLFYCWRKKKEKQIFVGVKFPLNINSFISRIGCDGSLLSWKKYKKFIQDKLIDSYLVGNNCERSQQNK